MPYIKVNTERLLEAKELVNNSKGKIDSVNVQFYTIGTALDWDIKISSDINYMLEQIQGELDDAVNCMRNMESFFDFAVKEYNSVSDQKISGNGVVNAIRNAVQIAKDSSAGRMLSNVMRQAGTTVANSVSINGKNANKEIAKRLSISSKVIKFAKPEEDAEGVSTVASALSLASSASLLKGSTSAVESGINALNVNKAAIGVAEKATKWGQKALEKRGNEEIKEWIKKNKDSIDVEFQKISLFGDTMGAVGDLAENIAESESMGGFIKNSGDFAESVGDIVEDWMQYDDTVKKTKANPTMALVNMGLYTAGDVMEKLEDDGKLSAQETADTMMGAGLQGADSLLRSATGGIIGIDTEKALTTFNGNIAEAREKLGIDEMTGAKKWAVAVITSPGIAAWSVGEYFVDVGYQIGEKVKKIKLW